MLFLLVIQLFIGDCRGLGGEVYKKLNNFPPRLSTGFSIFMPDQGHRMKMGDKRSLARILLYNKRNLFSPFSWKSRFLISGTGFFRCRSPQSSPAWLKHPRTAGPSRSFSADARSMTVLQSRQWSKRWRRPSASPRSFAGHTVLLKPNLISATAPALACTNAEFIAGVAAVVSRSRGQGQDRRFAGLRHRPAGHAPAWHHRRPCRDGRDARRIHHRCREAAGLRPLGGNRGRKPRLRSPRQPAEDQGP